MARGSWNSWELPEPPSGSRGERRRGIKGKGGSRELQAVCSLPRCAGAWVQGLLVCVCVQLCAHACFPALVCASMWYLLRSLGLYAAKGGLVVWPGLAGRYRMEDSEG